MGQELTARTKYRGLIKRRLFPVRIDGRCAFRQRPVQRDGRDVGEIRPARATAPSHAADRGSGRSAWSRKVRGFFRAARLDKIPENP
jgi:hypothetical protein